MKLADVFVRCLIEEDIDTVFGYPGAAVLSFYESLRTSSIHHVLVRQEQAAVHAANGYARTSGKVGVCMATSGPGATNLITGIATAYADSIPVVVFTGQVKSHMIGQDVFQEVDIIGATEAFVKHSYLLQDPKDFVRIMKEAFYIAKSGRPGPVLIDVPMDYQDEQIEFNYSQGIDIRGYKPTIKGHVGQIKRAVKLLQHSERPLICVGGGVILANAKEEIEVLLEKSKIPVVHTLMGTGAVPTSSPYYCGMIGSHGFAHANWAFKQADTILIIGARMADRTLANIGKIDENTNIIHIDVDPAEIGKITGATIPVVGDAKEVLSKMNTMMCEKDTSQWMNKIQEHRFLPKERIYEGCVNPKKIIKLLSECLPEDAVVTADVGQNQFWTMRHMEVKGDRKLLCSGGLGTMGYSLPACIGACMADRKRKVVGICGDGSFQMSLFELGTIAQEGLKPIIMLFNNSGLGMVREMQWRLETKDYGVSLAANPDFKLIANAYGIEAMTITDQDDVEEIIKEVVKKDKACLLEFIVSDKESTL